MAEVTRETWRVAMPLSRALASRYEFIDRLGNGGLGELYRVRDKITRELLALRLTIFISAPEIIDALTTTIESHTTLALQGAPIVRVVAAGSDEGSAWYVMESAEGESVLDRVRRLGRMPAPNAARLVRQLADCFALLHGRSALHQDLSPRNVFVDGDSVKVLELGVGAALARALKARPGAFSSPRWKAPEQLVADAEPRTDLYALGCLLYYVLTARKAIADGAPNLRLATRGGMRLPKLDNLPAELRPILVRTLAMRPDDRFASAEELSKALADTGLAS